MEKKTGVIETGGQLGAVLVGNGLLALSATAFALPHSFAMTGVNGVALVLEHYLGISMAMSIALINGITFFLGLYFLGKAFALKTVVSTVVYPVLFQLFSQSEMLAALTRDRFMAAVMAGILTGVGLGLVMRVGGSTGGLDIPPLILHKYFRWSVALVINGISLGTLLIQAFYSDSEQILYGVISTLVTGVVLNQVLLYGEENIQALIISRKHKEINGAIQQRLQRGSTLIPIETGYHHVLGKAVLCVLPARELGSLTREIQAIDPGAFVIMANAREVRGGVGFTLAKDPAPEDLWAGEARADRLDEI